MFVFQKFVLFLASQRRHLSIKDLWIIPVLFFCLPMTGLAEEQITDFSSEVIILESGKIAVIENITVKAEGNRIKRVFIVIFLLVTMQKAGSTKFLLP